MGSVAVRYCARGDRCKLYDPETGKPQKLGRYHKSDVCDRCRLAGDTGNDAIDAGVEERFSDLLYAARVLIEAKVTDEDQIVPTLVYAANHGKVQSLNGAYASLIADPDDPTISDRTYQWFYEAFDGFVVISGSKDSVPILREPPFGSIAFRGRRGYVQEINLDVFKRSVKREEVAEAYGQALENHGLSCDPERGEVAYKFHDRSGESFLRIIARPETRLADPADARVLPVTIGTPRFPEPQVVGAFFEALRGTTKKGEVWGYGSRLAGRARGKKRSNSERLVLACVAWYVGGRGKVVREHALKPSVAKLLNRRLLEHCERESLSEIGWDSSETLWKRDLLDGVGAAILRLERAVERRAGVGVFRGSD